MNLDYLKDFRKSTGLTKTDFAKSIGCPPSTYFDVENGDTDLRVSQLMKLMDYEDFDIEKLLEKKFIRVDNTFAVLCEEQSKIIDKLKNKIIELILEKGD